MPLRPVPWATSGGVDGKGGAENSVELARVGLYVSTKGGTGIIEANDFRVTQLPVPGAAVRILKGSGAIKSTYPGVFGQSYGVQEESFTDAPVAATGSAGAAVKYVYVLIQDSQYAGQQPANIKTGPYNSYQVSTSLPANAPYMLLARIDQPANTATITNQMITDMRKIADPKQWTVDRSRASVASAQGMALNSKTAAGEWFPGDGTPTGARQRIDVPDWATRMIIKPAWYKVRYERNANVWGRCWINYGPSSAEGNYNGQPFPYNTQEFAFDVSEGPVSRDDWLSSDDRYIPAAMRGKEATFAFRARRHDSSTIAGAVRMDGVSGLDLTVQFLQVPDMSTE